jgi:uncharacterized membrane protein YidH (DUF202 family)
MTAPGPDQAGDDPEERDSGLARERTSLSWTRTAIAFAALGGTVLKVNLATGLIILVIAPVIWQLGRVSRGGGPGAAGQAPAMTQVSAHRLFLITVSIVGVALLCLVIAILGRSAPGALR